MLALARVASSSNSWSGAQQENSVRNDSDCVRKKLSARNFRQVSCLKVQSPRVVFVELPEQHIEILLSREQTQIDEGFFHLPLIQSPVDSGIHGADQRSSDPCASIFSAPRHASWQSGGACQCSRVTVQHRERVLQWYPDPFLSVSYLSKALRSFSIGTEERPLTSSLRSYRLVKARCVFVSTAKRVCHFIPVDEMIFRPNTHTCVSMTTDPTHQDTSVQYAVQRILLVSMIPLLNQAA